MLAGWRLALSVGLAGVRAAGRRGHQGGGGVRLEGAAGQVIGRAVRCSSGRPSPPRPGRSGRPSPWAARSFPVPIGAAAVLIGAGRGQKKSQGGRRRPFTLAFSFLLLIEAGRPFPVLIGAGAVGHWFRLHLIHPHGSRWHRSRAAQFRRRMIRQNAARAKGSDSSLNGISPHR